MALADIHLFPSRVLSCLMSCVTLNRVDVDVEAEEVKKRRTGIGVLLIWAGNIYAWIAWERVRVLTSTPWKKREIWLYRHVHGVDLEEHSDGTLVLKWLGESVHALLQQKDTRLEFRVQLATEVGRALHKLHHMDYQGRPVSHADTSMKNVAYDPKTGVASWFDFEMEHTSNLSTAERQADDLRGMLFTFLSLIPAQELEPVFQHMWTAYAPTREQTLVLQQILDDPSLRKDAYHRAQVLLPEPEHHRITLFLREQVRAFSA